MTLPYIINAHGVNEAFAEGMRHLHTDGVQSHSRNGVVSVAPGPVITVTRQPMERVLFSPVRDANPFFHLFESLWMLAGRNDLPWLAQFNQQMASYSDDGGLTQPAAYGYRWRKWFNYDQIEAIVKHLQEQPNSRRAVLTMWDAWPMAMDMNGAWKGGDVEKAFSDGKDVPCNTNCFFGVRGDYLDMSVQCRSNDAVWGAHGANAVHFSVLLEYVAARLDLVPGTMYQYSFNYHLYPDNLKVDVEEMARNADRTNAYRNGAGARVTPLFVHETTGGIWERELAWFMMLADPKPIGAGDFSTPLFTEPFFCGTALPMLRAWRAHKDRKYDLAFKELSSMAPHSDWRIACETWMAKRAANYEEKQRGNA